MTVTLPRYSSDARHALEDGTGVLVGEHVVVADSAEAVDWAMVDVAGANSDDAIASFEWDGGL